MDKLVTKSINAKLHHLQKVPIVVGVKCTATSDSQAHPSHMHDCTELWYSLSGEAIHTVGEEHYVQTTGSCVIVPSFVPHHVQVIKNDDTPIFMCINVLDNALRDRGYDYFSYYNKRIYFSGKILPRFYKFSGKDRIYANDIIHKLSTEFSALPNASFDTLFGLYVDFLRLLGGEQCIDSPSASLLERSEAILKATDYIYKNQNKSISTKELCKIANMSRSRFFEYFTEITGVSPSNYASSVKMPQVLIAFLERGKSLSEITEMFGASDKSHLCRLVKKHYGKTLSELRELYQIPQQLHDLETRERLSNLDSLIEYFSNNP